MEGKKKPYVAVVLIHTIYAGMFLLSKAAFNGGMNSFVFVFYRQATATVFLVPVTLLTEWRNAPHLSFATFCEIFVLSLCGITAALDISGMATVYTSATLAAATANTLPVITFFMALLLRVEVLRLRTLAGMAKIVGITLCLGGAAALAFYKGPNFDILHGNAPLGHVGSQGGMSDVAHDGNKWMRGCLLMLTSNILWGLWIVLQGRVLKKYPSKLLFTTLQCSLSSVQTFVIAIAVERDPNQWKLGWDVSLLAVAYCGIVVTGVTYYLQAWVIEKKGPVFLAMSTPLSLIVTIFSSAFLLGDAIALGSIIGGTLLVGGLYAVLWGKRREEQMVSDGNQSLPTHHGVEKQSSQPNVD